MGDERRRHERLDAATVKVGGVSLDVGSGFGAVEVKDVGVGGCFVFVDPPPPLRHRVTVTLAGLTLSGVVVRVQRGGRDKGRPVSGGVAIAFTGVDEATLGALDRLLR